MRVREHVDCTCVCDGNCYVISVLSHSLSCSLVSVRRHYNAVRNAWYRLEVTYGTIELKLNFVHMWETKETVLTGRGEAALDSYSTLRSARRTSRPCDVSILLKQIRNTEKSPPKS